jgi:hypothetical protein
MLRYERTAMGIGLENLNRAVRRAVVHSVDMQVGIALCEDTAKRALQIAFHVVARQNHRYFGPDWSAFWGHDRSHCEHMQADERLTSMLVR